MIYTVGNTKGGVGKTITALNVAIALALKGRDVWLVNGDRQKTAGQALDNRAATSIEPAIAYAHYPDGATLRNQVLHQRAKYDDIVIDVGGRDSTALRAAMFLTDVLLVPFQPRSFDIWAITELVEILDEARSVRGDFPALAFLNMAEAGDDSKDNAEAREAIAEITQLTFIDAPVRDRKAFSNAGGLGMSVLEFRPKNHKAIAELQTLMAALPSS